MSLVSFFTARCKWCDDDFEIRTGSADECNRCRTIMTLVANLSVYDLEKLLNEVNKSKAEGRWRIRWETTGDASHD